ncbi:hypothetical protein X975_04504, partial [Stegodyphus mimosarum]
MRYRWKSYLRKILLCAFTGYNDIQTKLVLALKLFRLHKKHLNYNFPDYVRDNFSLLPAF